MEPAQSRVTGTGLPTDSMFNGIRAASKNAEVGKITSWAATLHQFGRRFDVVGSIGDVCMSAVGFPAVGNRPALMADYRAFDQCAP